MEWKLWVQPCDLGAAGGEQGPLQLGLGALGPEDREWHLFPQLSVAQKEQGL